MNEHIPWHKQLSTLLVLQTLEKHDTYTSRPTTERLPFAFRQYNILSHPMAICSIVNFFLHGRIISKDPGHSSVSRSLSDCCSLAEVCSSTPDRAYDGGDCVKIPVFSSCSSMEKSFSGWRTICTASHTGQAGVVWSLASRISCLEPLNPNPNTSMTSRARVLTLAWAPCRLPDATDSTHYCSGLLLHSKCMRFQVRLSLRSYARCGSQRRPTIGFSLMYRVTRTRDYSRIYRHNMTAHDHNSWTRHDTCVRLLRKRCCGHTWYTMAMLQSLRRVEPTLGEKQHPTRAHDSKRKGAKWLWLQTGSASSQSDASFGHAGYN